MRSSGVGPPACDQGVSELTADRLMVVLEPGLGVVVALFVILQPWPLDWGSSDRAIAALVTRLAPLVGLGWMILIVCSLREEPPASRLVDR